jgi:alkylhydroperoxidase/carboxymuconolactone decarboxylase family protein YurZ
MENNQEFDHKQQSLVAISALTAKGDITGLKTHLNNALDAGLTISEIKEELVQLYAYCGFPRSLNAVNAFMEVVEERKEITISTLATLSGVESQLKAHINMGMNTGITDEQLKEAFLVIGTIIGKKEGDSALEVLKKVVETRNENNK